MQALLYLTNIHKQQVDICGNISDHPKGITIVNLCMYVKKAIPIYY